MCAQKRASEFQYWWKKHPVGYSAGPFFNISSTSEPILIYCQSGKRSMEAARKIKKLFQKKVFSLKGGMNGISEEHASQ
jgi:adenylyltransferase/sulfurtransferase